AVVNNSISITTTSASVLNEHLRSSVGFPDPREVPTRATCSSHLPPSGRSFQDLERAEHTIHNRRVERRVKVRPDDDDVHAAGRQVQAAHGLAGLGPGFDAGIAL